VTWAGCLQANLQARIEMYGAALQAIADHDVAIIFRSVDIVGLDKRYPDGHDHPHSIVLTRLIERVDECAERLGQTALLIADEVDGLDDYRREHSNQRSSTWATAATKSRKVDRLSSGRFGSARYSTPSRLIGAAVLVEIHGTAIRVLEPFTGEVAAEHPLVAPGEVSVCYEHYGSARPDRPRAGTTAADRAGEAVPGAGR
jgi:hypothetical protein